MCLSGAVRLRPGEYIREDGLVEGLVLPSHVPKGTERAMR